MIGCKSTSYVGFASVSKLNWNNMQEETSSAVLIKVTANYLTEWLLKKMENKMKINKPEKRNLKEKLRRKALCKSQDQKDKVTPTDLMMSEDTFSETLERHHESFF